ncbi:hypothetical protein L596_013435 [Steinernema carpocapsae]|uniref:Uncharacterized protein n=1 Tax=Steinernema carpocapsae TaxID=34508 RepID=A0A4U5P048_STECR|nr:hypothetical protein L596_013435 [Steinernema carpocapsae]
MFVSLKIKNNDFSRLFTMWLYCTQVPNDVIQPVICVFQLIGLIDSSGNYYRDTPDYVQICGKYFTDMANNAYRILAIQMLMATSMSYLLPFTFAKVFHPK